MPSLASASSNSGLVMPDCSHTAAGFAARMSSRWGGRSEGLRNTSRMSMRPATNSSRAQQTGLALATAVAILQPWSRLARHASSVTAEQSSASNAAGLDSGCAACLSQRCSLCATAQLCWRPHLARPAPGGTQAAPRCVLPQGRTRAPAPPQRLPTAGTVARRRLAGWPAERTDGQHSMCPCASLAEHAGVTTLLRVWLCAGTLSPCLMSVAACECVLLLTLSSVLMPSTATRFAEAASCDTQHQLVCEVCTHSQTARPLQVDLVGRT